MDRIAVKNVPGVRPVMVVVVMIAVSAGGCDGPNTPSSPASTLPQGAPPAPAPPAPSPPADIVVSGIVHETAPTPHRVIAGATVTAIMEGRTETAVADAAGRFSVTAAPGEVRLTIAASRYETVTSMVNAATDTGFDVALPYTFRMIDEVFEGNAGDVSRITFQLPVHHDGIIGYGGYACVAGCTAGVFEWQCGELRDETGTVLAHDRGFYDNGPGNQGVAVKGGHVYQLTLWQCAGRFENWPISNYEVHVRRPI
jgi:hypothetical protein